jgi:alkylated DNA repair protein alkB family protein 8/tRNA (uracil-5-)-methyltransferase TRM9
MDQQFAKEILKKVKDDYNLIAEDYSASRPSVWKELSIFNSLIKDGDKVLDLGCGNGRLVELFNGKAVDYLGVDNSENLLSIAKKRYPKSNFLLADALNLPFPDNSFDAVFSIAVLHHIPGRELRIKFFDEAKRVLKPGGVLVLTVWNLFRSKTLPLLFRHSFLKTIGLSKLEYGDVLVPWADKTNRYYHYFTKREMTELVKKTNFEIIEIGSLKSIGNGRDNLYLVAKKPQIGDK